MVGLWYIYSIFILYLFYIYGIFILCCGLGESRVVIFMFFYDLKVGVFGIFFVTLWS